MAAAGGNRSSVPADVTDEDGGEDGLRPRRGRARRHRHGHPRRRHRPLWSVGDLSAAPTGKRRSPPTSPAPSSAPRRRSPICGSGAAGAIVAVSSGAGKQGYPQLAAYSASKFGLMGFMQGLAAEVAADGIKVCTVVPGSILTPFAGRTVAEKQAAMAKRPRQEVPGAGGRRRRDSLPAAPAKARLDAGAESVAVLSGVWCAGTLLTSTENPHPNRGPEGTPPVEPGEGLVAWNFVPSGKHSRRQDTLLPSRREKGWG